MEMKALVDATVSEHARGEQLKMVITQDYATRRHQIELRLAEAQAQIREKLLTGAQDMFGNMDEVAKAFGRKGFVAFKAFASAQATISAILATMRALADIPYPLNLVAAGAAAAAGAVNIAKIAATAPSGFAEGGRPPVGEMVMVGERGPELFMADRPGMILTNDMTRGLMTGTAAQPAETLGGRREANINLHAYFNKRQALEAWRDDLEGMMVDVMNRNRSRFAI